MIITDIKNKIDVSKVDFNPSLIDGDYDSKIEKRPMIISENEFNAKYISALFLLDNGLYSEVFSIVKDIDNWEVEEPVYEKENRIADLYVLKYTMLILGLRNNRDIEDIQPKLKEIITKYPETIEFGSTSIMFQTSFNILFSLGVASYEMRNRYGLKDETIINYPKRSGVPLQYINGITQSKVVELKTSTLINIIANGINNSHPDIKRIIDMALNRSDITEQQTRECLLFGVLSIPHHSDFNWGLTMLRKFAEQPIINFFYKEKSWLISFLDIIGKVTQLDYLDNNIKDGYKQEIYNIYKRLRYNLDGINILMYADKFKTLFNKELRDSLIAQQYRYYKTVSGDVDDIYSWLACKMEMYNLNENK